MVQFLSYIIIFALGLIFVLIARAMFLLLKEDQAAEIDLGEVEETTSVATSQD